MKPALVLGLALAANAMTVESGDNNELFVAPTGKLGDLAQRFPGKIMYDEVADEELAIKYVQHPHIPAPEYVAYDEVADDELGVYVPTVLAKYDEVADDELAIAQQILHLPVEHVAFDDDELAYKKPRRDDPKIAEKGWTRPEVAFDDDELAVKYVHLPEVVAYDDDEFVGKRPREEKPKPRDEAKVYENYMRAREAINRPQHQHKPRDEAKWHNRPEHNRPEHNRPEHNRPEHNRPEHNRPEHNRPQHNRPQHNRPEHNRPQHNRYQHKPREESKMTEAYKQAMGWKRNQPIKEADDEFAIIQQIAQLPEHAVFADDDELAYVPPVLADDELAYVPPVLADDELAINVHQYQGMQNIRNPIYSRFDEVADDELAYAHPIYAKYDEVADDELAYAPPVLMKFDEVADDELGIKYVHLPVPETQNFDDDELMTVHQYQGVQNLGSLHTRFDEVADDELAMNVHQYQNMQNIRSPIYSKFDEVADDELAINQQIIHLPVDHIAFADDDEFAYVKYDEVADDELAYVHPIYAKYDEVADDELAYATPIYAKFDEADDELAYLGQLIRDGGYIPRIYADDELRAEKPSHGKTQEKTQKSDKPKRKLRPIVDERIASQE